MIANIKCVKCNMTNELIPEDTFLKKVTIDDESKKELILTFYQCPLCKCSYVVSLDDKYTVSLLDEIKSLSIKIRNKKIFGQDAKRKQYIKINKSNKKLEFYRNLLIEKYKNSFYHYEEDKCKMDICDQSQITGGGEINEKE